MFLLRATGHSPTTALSRRLLFRPQWQSIPPITLPIPRSILPRLRAFRVPSDASNRGKRPLTYPRNANVFNSGPAPTLVLGFTRVTCLVVFGFGVLWAAPGAIINPSVPWYWALIWPVITAVPLLVTGFLFGGVVNHINIILPSAARRSKDDLMRFAARVPAGTKVQIKSMWFRPWPHTNEVVFEDLRRLPPGRFGLGTNMEHQPFWNRENAESNPGWNWVAKRWMGRYLVMRGQLKDRSRVPGVWDRMWEQIPIAGEAGEVDNTETAKETVKKAAVQVRKPTTMANRSNTASSQLERRAPPPRKPRR